MGWLLAPHNAASFARKRLARVRASFPSTRQSSDSGRHPIAIPGRPQPDESQRKSECLISTWSFEQAIQLCEAGSSRQSIVNSMTCDDVSCASDRVQRNPSQSTSHAHASDTDVGQLIYGQSRPTNQNGYRFWRQCAHDRLDLLLRSDAWRI